MIKRVKEELQCKKIFWRVKEELQIKVFSLFFLINPPYKEKLRDVQQEREGARWSKSCKFSNTGVK